MRPEVTTSILPEVIATLNGISFVLLMAGFVFVKRKQVNWHRICMSLALMSSALFLSVYLWHHYEVGSVPYPRHDWTYTLYLIILIPHIILAVVMLPLIFLAFKWAIKNEITKHKKIVRFLYPIWTYVSFTGLVVYFMLYRLN